MANPVYPPLSELVDARAIPGDIAFIENNAQAAIDTLLGKIFYKNLVTDVSSTGDRKTYRLTLIAQALRQELFSTGLELVFFRIVNDQTEFDVSFEWQWPIRRYIRGFEVNGFSYAPEAFAQVLLRMAGINGTEEFIGELVRVLLHDGKGTYKAYLNALIGAAGTYGKDGAEGDAKNIQDQLTIIRDRVQLLLEGSSQFTIVHLFERYASDPVLAPAVDSIRTSVRSLIVEHDADIDLCFELLKAFLVLLAGDPEESLRKLLRLFEKWLGDLTLDRLKYLLIPQFALRIHDVGMALEFPRSLLIPMEQINESWKVVADETKKASLEFTVGTLGYSTQSGLDIGFSKGIPLSMQRCQLPGIGIQFQFQDIVPDLSRDYNIPQVQSDNRPEDFIGVYIGSADIFLPEEWFRFDEKGSTLRICGKDLIAGTGGLSGTIGLAAASGSNPKLAASMTLTDGRKITLAPTGPDGTIGEGSPVQLQDSDAPIDDGKYALAGGGTIVVTSQILQTYLPSGGEICFDLGRSGDSGSWKIGFSEFYMKFWQSRLQESSIKGSLTIPNFKEEHKTEDLKIDIEVFFETDGDFRITAAPEGGLTFCLGENGKIFKLTIDSLEAAKDDEKLYLQVSGSFDFSANPLLGKFISKPIAVKKLRIYSNGSFELEGGSLPIPGSVHMNLGPVEVAITNITLGSETFDSEPYKFFGFDCGVSAGASGLDLRGDGIKVYFNHDGSDLFLRIAGIGVDLMIPGTATEETAALIISGYLSLKEHEYAGAVSFKLPKVGIAGGAAMKMSPSVPAFIVDASLELSAPIPLGGTGLGIYGFRGLFGLRYRADLPEGATEDPEKLFDFYTQSKSNPLTGHDEQGLHLGKFVTPGESADQFRSSGTPVSIGAGVTIGTVADAGYVFSMQAFLFLSLPELFMISGKANILHERVGLSGDEPPFFAYLAFTSQYVSVGMGADYKVRAGEGQFLDLHAEAKMAYFFSDASAWYVHVGTKEEPNKAKVLKKIFGLDVYAYLMLSAAGIEAGAGVRFEKSKSYGPVSLSIKAYGDVYAMLSFRKVQAGGGIACGGSIAASVFGVGFSISLDAYLTLTVPKPFIVEGGMSFTLSVDLWLWTWKRTISLELSWTFEQNADHDPIGILGTDSLVPVSGYHIGSGKTYALSYYGTELPATPDLLSAVETIPLDTYIDIQFKKPVDPKALNGKIGGYSNAPVGTMDQVPPKNVKQQVTHQFFVQDVSVKVWSAIAGAWIEYDPYAVLSEGSVFGQIDSEKRKLGFWQKKGKEYKDLRLLSTNPFCYADVMPGGVVPEQLGLTAGVLYCRSKEKKTRCTQWSRHAPFAPGIWHSYKYLTFRVTGHPAAVIPFQNVYHISESLTFHNSCRMEINLPEQSLRASVKLFSYAKKVRVSFFDLRTEHIVAGNHKTTKLSYVLVRSVELSVSGFVVPVVYEDPNVPVKRIVIEPLGYDPKGMKALQDELAYQKQRLLMGYDDAAGKIRTVTQKIERCRADSCRPEPKRSNDDRGRMLGSLIAARERLERKTAKAGMVKDRFRMLTSGIAGTVAELEREALRNPLRSVVAAATSGFATAPGLQSKTEALHRKTWTKYAAQLDRMRTDAIRRQAAAAEQFERAKKKHDGLVRLLAQADARVNGLQSLLQLDLRNRDLYPCNTFVHEVCFVTEQDYWYNESIPSQEAVDADYSAMQETVDKTIAPIWRPDETFLIGIATRETIGWNGGQKTEDINHYFAFKTAGPIGHFPLRHLPEQTRLQFHLDPDGNPLAPVSKELDQRVELPENALKFYLDFKRCYPNPSGNILNQKPLYYKDASLLLFYTQPYVYHFFHDWPAQQGLIKRFASLEVQIKDPTEGIASQKASPVLPVLPSSETSWLPYLSPLSATSWTTINRLRNPKLMNPLFDGPTCWKIGGEPVVPASKFPEITLKDLRPSKLYNAVLFCTYSKEGIFTERKQVHSYPFQTSRYGDLDEQVNSYRLKDPKLKKGKTVVEAKAVYTLTVDLKQLGTTADALKTVAQGKDLDPVVNEQLVRNYPMPFERLLLGYLQLKPLHAAMHTEFNLIRDPKGALLAIYVRSPEPFNDPQIPSEALKDSVRLLVNNKTKNAEVVFSKDNSQFLVCSDFFSGASDLRIRFSYLVWNGDTYEANHVTTTGNLL